MNRLMLIVSLILVFPLVGQEWQTTISSARNAYRKGDFERAAQLYKGVNQKQVNQLKLSPEFGQSAYRTADFSSAQHSFEQASKQAKGKQKAVQFYNLGNSFMKQKKYDEAINAFKNALRISPNDREAQYNLSEAMRKKKNNQSNPPPNNQKNQSPPSSKNNPPKEEKPGKNDFNKNIPSKSVDRMLDQLMKAEAETKRKIAGSRQQQQKKKSEKDW